MTDKSLSETIVDALEDVKGIDILTVDVSEFTDVADQMVVATGSTRRQVQALADSVLENLSEAGIKAFGVEGKETAEWVLIDYGDVVVHILLPEAREFYDLERLWTMTSHKRSEAGSHSSED